MNCVDCGTPLTREEITYYGSTCDRCEGRRLYFDDDTGDGEERDRLMVDSQFDGLTETVIVQVR